MKIFDVVKENKRRVLIISSLMLIIPEIVFTPILNFVYFWPLNGDKYFNDIWLIEHIFLYYAILIIQLVGIIGLMIFVFLFIKEQNNGHIKLVLYFLLLSLFALLCFIGVIFFLLYVFANLSIGL